MARLALIAAFALVACSAEPDQKLWFYGERAPDAAALDTRCATPASIGREVTFDHTYLDTHATCPPDVASWWTYDPDVMHCEWRCVSYGCAPGQDVRIDYATDSSVVAIESGASSHCG